MANSRKTQGRVLFKRSTIAACVMAATAAHVQAQEAASDDPALLEEVVVYGIKQSLQDARDIKREAATVKDVITASDIGALPDKSVVEALQRVPGVAIERFEASDDPDHFSVEGGGVTIRGLNRVRSEFNGRDSFSAGADGKMDFSDIAPELVGSVEVVKNSTADLVEGGSAGTVNIITRKPFDKDELQAAATVKGSYGDLADKVDPNISGIVSNVWDTDSGKFGALFSIAASTTSTRSDGVGMYNFYPLVEDSGEVDDDGNPIMVENGLIAPNGGRVNRQENERDRLSISGAFQYANPSDTFQATLEFIRSDSQLSWVDHVVENPAEPFSADVGAINGKLNLSNDSRFDCAEDPYVINGANCQFTRGTLYGGDFPWGAVPYVAGTRVRDEDRVVNDVSLNLEYTPMDALTLTADLQYAQATNDIYDMSAHGKFWTDTYIDITHSDEARVDFTNDNLDDVNEYFMRSAMDHVSENEGDEFAFAFDGEYEFDDSWVTSIKAGVRFSNKETTVKESDYNWKVVSEAWLDDQDTAGATATFEESWAADGVIEQFTFDSHFDSLALTTTDTFWFPSEALLRDTRATHTAFTDRGMFRKDADHWVPIEDRTNNAYDADGNPLPLVDGKFLNSEVYVTEEERSAAFVRVDFGDENADKPWSGNVGLRYVSYQLTSTGSFTFPDAPSATDQDPTLEPALTPDDIAYTNGAAVTTTIVGEKFTRVLPSFNFKYGIQDDLIARFAASEAVYLPELRDVRAQSNIGVNYDRTTDGAGGPPTGISVINYTTNSGNPYLQPELTSNYDLALEWYFGDIGSVTGTLFYKKTRDAWRRGTEVSPVTNESAGVTRNVQFTSLVNYGKSTVQGYELAAQTTFGFLSDALENFGIQGSYTFIDGSFDDTAEVVADDSGQVFRNFASREIEGLSKENTNLQIYYDDGTFQTRFAYSWRSSWLLNARDVIAYSPVYGEPTGQLDWSASLQVSDNIKVGLEANNLLNEVVKTSIQYNQIGELTPRSYNMSDRRFGAYVQATF